MISLKKQLSQAEKALINISRYCEKNNSPYLSIVTLDILACQIIPILAEGPLSSDVLFNSFDKIECNEEIIVTKYSKQPIIFLLKFISFKIHIKSF